MTGSATRASPRALGLSVHTGWAACVVVGGSPSELLVLANERIDLVSDSERFCFHLAAELPRASVARWLARVRATALANARRALTPLLAQVSACAIVAGVYVVGLILIAIAPETKGKPLPE